MKPINIRKTIDTVTTWFNDEQKQKVQHESDSTNFYFFSDDKITASFEQSEAADLLKKCDALISAGFNEMDMPGKDFIPNLPFLSMVLSQFLHVPKVKPAHDVEENLPTQPTVITNSSQLVVGEHYADCQNKNFATVLEFVKTDRDNNRDYFKYVSGPKTYLHSVEDLIMFDCDERWYKIN
jgi:hypothetical protein